jgi:hypothetical protein
LILASGIVFAVLNWGAFQNNYWKNWGSVWGSRNKTMTVNTCVKRSIPKGLIRLDKDVNQPVAANLEEFFKVGSQLEIATNFWGFQETQDKNECWFTKVAVTGTLNRSRFSQVNSGKIWVNVPTEYLSEGTSSNAHNRGYQHLHDQGRGIKVATVRQATSSWLERYCKTVRCWGLEKTALL